MAIHIIILKTQATGKAKIINADNGGSRFLRKCIYMASFPKKIVLSPL